MSYAILLHVHKPLSTYLCTHAFVHMQLFTYFKWQDLFSLVVHRKFEKVVCLPSQKVFGNDQRSLVDPRTSRQRVTGAAFATQAPLKVDLVIRHGRHAATLLHTGSALHKPRFATLLCWAHSSSMLVSSATASELLLERS